MRSQRQHTDLGTLLERDWVTTNGLNVLRFGSGRKIWYNSGSFVFTTANIPSYHKKHKLSTETTEWKWNDCESADSTVNTVMPTFNTTDMRDYAYYGSCAELIRATIEDVISDFPGRLTSTSERLIISGESINDWYGDSHPSGETIKPSKEDISYDNLNDEYYYFNGSEWHKTEKVDCDRDVLDKTVKAVGSIYYVKDDNAVKVLTSKNVKGNDLYYLENYGNATNKFAPYYVHNELMYYVYNYQLYNDNKEPFVKTNEIPSSLINGYSLNNPFNIDLHHKKVTLGTYDNAMRFMSNSWNKYCIKVKRLKEDDTDCGCQNDEIDDKYCLLVGDVVGYKIEDKDESPCKSENEGRLLKIITFETNNREINFIKVYGYYLNGAITYVYKPSKYGETITIQPQQSYIDEYFNNLTGFKKQLLRQDTKPLYMNNFITPTEYNFVWYYPVKSYIWPSNDYCVDINSSAFTSFVSKLYDIGQNFDDMWSDNLYRSMTHESIKNFDWSYSREYYEGDEQDNVDGGERLQKIIRVFGRVFDDIKVYMDTLKSIPNITYDKYKNAPEALLSDNNDVSGFDVKSTIDSSYVLDTNIDSEFLDYERWICPKCGKVYETKTNECDCGYKGEFTLLKYVSKKNSWTSLNGNYVIHSPLSKWYPTRNSTDIYPDIADNEFMRRLVLSSKRIMQTKGTQESIEMIFGMFGFGDGDFTITEEAYYTERPIRSDECLDGTIDGEPNYDCRRYDCDWSKTTGVDWKEITSSKKGDLAEEINSAKDLEKLYFYDGDALSGTPMREVSLGRKNNIYLVPYYDSTQLYDDNLIYQGKGGWGKMIKNNDSDPLDDSLDYQETLSYLHVVGTVGELLTINPNVVDDNDIYYVASLSDYTEYDENPPMDIENDVTMSHYFILLDSANPNELYSWKNIVVKTALDSDGKLQKVDDEKAFASIFGKKEGDVDVRDWKFKPDDDGTETDTEKLGTYKYAFMKMQYLDNIFSTNLGNNPHVGYGQYDDGSKYIEYMKLPFKYLIDNSSLLPQNSSLYELSKNYTFNDINVYRVKEDFTNIYNNKETNYRKNDLISVEEYVVKLTNNNKKMCEFVGTDDKIQLMNSRQGNTYSDYIKYTSNGNTLTKEYKLTDDAHNVEKRWFINSKVLMIENKMRPNSLFNNYFKSVIMPYVMQVIPSTTILKLKGFS